MSEVLDKAVVSSDTAKCYNPKIMADSVRGRFPDATTAFDSVQDGTLEESTAVHETRPGNRVCYNTKLHETDPKNSTCGLLRADNSKLHSAVADICLGACAMMHAGGCSSAGVGIVVKDALAYDGS